MAYRNLKECVRDLEAHGQLKRIAVPLDPHLEIAAIQRRACEAGAPALLFTHPKDCGFPMLANLFGTRERADFIFRDTLPAVEAIFKAGTDPLSLARKPLQALKFLPHLWNMRPKSVARAPVLARQCGPEELPRLVSWPADGGPFITLPLVHSENPTRKGAANLGMYRVQLAGNEYGTGEIGMHYQLQRGIGIHHASALARGMELPVHVYVGGPPALTLAAIMPLPEGMSEFLFAGLLGGARTRLARPAGFELPVLAECDFLIRARIGSRLKPEGPFGDHLGYYSLRHPFPVARVLDVWHREDAIWPFTTVGRPPREDTVFGNLIHAITAPLVGTVFNGVREVHAVDAAGVHPLLLALGEERFTAYEATRKPRELITLAMSLLGRTQTALAKYVLIAAHADAPGLSVYNVAAFLRHMLERTDFGRDLHFITKTTADTLDYSGGALNEGSRLIWAAAGEKRRDLSIEISGLPQLPSGFSRPRVAAPGILLIQGPVHDLEPGTEDSAIGQSLGTILASWGDREGFPLVGVVDDPDFCAARLDNLLWVLFTRSDPAADIYGARASIIQKHWGCEAPLILDARRKPFHAPPLEEDPAVTRKIENMARRGGPLEGIF